MERKPSYLRLTNDPTVALRYDDKAFHVHRSLIFEASPVFKTAFIGNGNFLENVNQEMILSGSEVSIGSLERFVQWLYSGDYELSHVVDKQSTREQYRQLAELYVFGEKYVVVDLKNNIIDKLFELKKTQYEPPTNRILTYVYENTPPKSAFRELLVAHYTWHVNMEWYDRAATADKLYANPEFAADLAIQMGKRLSGEYKSPFDTHPSNFHAHKDLEIEQQETEK